MDTDAAKNTTPLKDKKRKVRSKQKNIRKDSRPLSAKPEHLRLGNPRYSGRPLTQETRQRLDLPPSKTSLHRIISEERKKSHHDDIGKIIPDDKPREDAPNEKELSSHLHVESKTSLSGSKKPRRSRYKNLVNHED